LRRPLALWEEAYRTRSDKPLRQREKPVERSTAARGHDVGDMRRHRFDSRIVNFDRRAGDARRLAQKGAFARIGLDQLDPGHPENRQHEARKPGAAAEVDEALGPLRDMGKELRRIEEMTAPKIAEGRSATYDMKPERDDPTAVGTSQVADAVIEVMGSSPNGAAR